MTSFRDLSIRRKLTLIVMITTCTAILLACGAFFAFDIHTLRQSRMHDLETLAEVLGSNSTAALTFNDPAAAREVLGSLSAKEPIMAAALYRIDEAASFATYVRDPALAPFSFHVFDAGETVQIEWDQNAAPIRKAHLGVIDVKDSGETKRYPLADDELHSGKMSYVRRGGDLELRMTVYPVGSTAVQEFAHFLDPGPVTPPAPSAEVEQLRQERDRLETEVKQLKEDLRKQQTPRRRRR